MWTVQMEGYLIRWVACGVLLWGTLFLAVRRLLFANRSFEFSNRFVSSAHATLAVTLACLSVEDWRCPVCPLASASSPVQMKILATSLSYMIYDLICCLCHKELLRMDDTVHHLVSIIGFGAGLAYRRCGTEMVAALWATEASSPLLHARELLKELGHRGTDLNLAVDVMFAVTFSGARMIFGPYLSYVTLTAANPFLIKAMALGLQLVSAFWFYKIVMMLRYKLVKRTKLP